MKLIVTIMSIETKTTNGTGIEQNIADLSSLALNLARLAILKGAMKLAGASSAYSDPSPAIPAQANDSHNTLAGPIDTIARCQGIFARAIEFHMESAESYVEPSLNPNQKGEYVALGSSSRGSFYLYRPTLEDEAVAQHPFWIREEVAVNHAETGLPGLYYREFFIDQLGNMQAKELLPGDVWVYRPLELYESQPYLDALTHPRVYPILPATVLAPTND